MKSKILKEAKQTAKDLAITKSLCGSSLTKEELILVKSLTESEMLSFGLDLFMVEKVILHAKKEEYRLRAQEQFTPEIPRARKSKITKQKLYPQKPYTRTFPLSESIQNVDVFDLSPEASVHVPENTAIPNKLAFFLGKLRAISFWFHSAHHTAKGTSFAGDHSDLYGRIYGDIQGEIDGAIEKCVGLTNDSTLACPLTIISLSIEELAKYPSPPFLDSFTIASVGLQVQREFLDFIESLFKELENTNELSLGFNDFLSAMANKHEEHVYLLQQRIKSDIGFLQ